MKLPLVLAFGGCVALAACSAGSNADGIPPGPQIEAGNDGARIPTNFQDTIVLVNALTTDALGDVRICPANPTAVARPNDRPMALTNFPGIARGRGLDLGAFDVSLGIDVFAASDLRNDIDTTCGSLRNNNAGKFKHLTAPAALGPSAIVLVDEANGTMTAKRIALQVGVTPTAEMVAAQFAFAGTGVTSDSLTLTFQGAKAQTGTAVSSAGFLVPRAFEEELVIRDDATFTYKQSLRSIQYVSDPTTDPQTFFDSRTQFLFILVGDPNDRYVSYKSPDALSGKELHVAAVPFDLVPKGAK